MSNIDYLTLIIILGLLLIGISLSYFLFGKKIKENLKWIALIFSILVFFMLRSYSLLQAKSRFYSPKSIFIDLLISLFAFGVFYLAIPGLIDDSGKKKD